MDDFCRETLIFWQILLVDVSNQEPVTKKEKIVKIVKSIGSKVLPATDLILIILIAPIFHDEDSPSFFNNPPALFGSAILFIVLSNLLHYTLVINKFDQIRKLATGPLSGNYSKEQQNKYNIGSKLSKLNRVLKYYRRFMLTAIPMEIFRAIYNLTISDRKAALSVEFPFDATQDYIYPIVIIALNFWNALNLLMTIVTDSLVCRMLTLTSFELDIWRQDFKDLKEASEDEKTRKLPELVERHVALFEVVKKVEDIFAPYFLINLLLNSVVISLNLYQIVLATEFLKKITNFSMCCSSLTTIGIICFLGQRLLNSSERISREIYDCGWESFKDMKLKKSALLLLMRSQKPAKLTFMKFSDVNMEQFGGVVAATYTYFTLLLKLRNKA